MQTSGTTWLSPTQVIKQVPKFGTHSQISFPLPTLYSVVHRNYYCPVKFALR